MPVQRSTRLRRSPTVCTIHAFLVGELWDGVQGNIEYSAVIDRSKPLAEAINMLCDEAPDFRSLPKLADGHIEISITRHSIDSRTQRVVSRVYDLTEFPSIAAHVDAEWREVDTQWSPDAEFGIEEMA